MHSLPARANGAPCSIPPPCVNEYPEELCSFHCSAWNKVPQPRCEATLTSAISCQWTVQHHQFTPLCLLEHCRKLLGWYPCKTTKRNTDEKISWRPGEGDETYAIE
ncbi:hypothetical protein KP509_12G039500 [Ceratopteris richardii]|uniref:Uncharacterized protein n=1 Tax=Ceratopteris richardii TaxID=49495 RepID=A0A8T2TNX5_CERRI|nr:hypothetical protein KP509_12G039500 [Ceratopteris richardii]